MEDQRAAFRGWGCDDCGEDERWGLTPEGLSLLRRSRVGAGLDEASRLAHRLDGQMLVEAGA